MSLRMYGIVLLVYTSFLLVLMSFNIYWLPFWLIAMGLALCGMAWVGYDIYLDWQRPSISTILRDWAVHHPAEFEALKTEYQQGEFVVFNDDVRQMLDRQTDGQDNKD